MVLVQVSPLFSVTQTSMFLSELVGNSTAKRPGRDGSAAVIWLAKAKAVGGAPSKGMTRRVHVTPLSVVVANTEHVVRPRGQVIAGLGDARKYGEVVSTV